jgi:hypothetical protein
VYKNFQCRNVQEMKRSIVKHCTPRSQIMWNVTLNSLNTSSYIINVDQNKKRKQSPRMRRRDCNLPLNLNSGKDVNCLNSLWCVRKQLYNKYLKQLMELAQRKLKGNLFQRPLRLWKKFFLLL